MTTKIQNETSTKNQGSTIEEIRTTLNYFIDREASVTKSKDNSFCSVCYKATDPDLTTPSHCCAEKKVTRSKALSELAILIPQISADLKSKLSEKENSKMNKKSETTPSTKKSTTKVPAMKTDKLSTTDIKAIEKSKKSAEPKAEKKPAVAGTVTIGVQNFPTAKAARRFLRKQNDSVENYTKTTNEAGISVWTKK